MNVLSLFDGMSCGQLALKKLGIKVDNYYACEIDKYAMQVTQANFPNTIQLGSVCDVRAKDLPKIDLILAGSPCQGFSFASKQLAFDDPRSALFFEFIRLLKECQPKYFLLENVRMKKEHLSVITEQVSQCYSGQGNDLFDSRIEPILINSSLVSAQSRQRYYWTNIPNIGQPEERGIVLKDILEENPQENPVKHTKRNARHLKQLDDKSLCMTATMYKGAGNNGMTLVPQHIGTAMDIKGHDVLRRVYSPNGKSPTLNTCSGGNREPKIVDNENYWRKLTPLECERLQTVPDNYTNHVSNSQRYRMLGNGWTIEVICHILKNMEVKTQ
jgi:DNA-cytosine methyltransferase